VQGGSSFNGSVNITDTLTYGHRSIPFAEMKFGDSTTTIALTQNTPAQITNSNNDLFTAGLSNDIAIQGDSMVVNTAGVYKATASLSFEGSNGSEIELQLFVNGSEACTCHPIIELSANKKASLAMPCDFIALSQNDVVKLYVENLANNDDITAIGAHVSLLKID